MFPNARKLSLVALFASLFAIVIFFQNCSMQGPQVRSIKDTVKEDVQTTEGHTHGNGEGYGGKVTSYLKHDSECSESNSTPSEIIEVSGNDAYLVRENCEDISPRAITDVEVAPHNQSFAFYQGAMFETEDIFGKTEVICRTDQFDLFDNQHEIADVYIQSEGEELFAYIKVGIYEQGLLSETIDAHRIPVEKIPPPPFLANSPEKIRDLNYLATDDENNQRFALNIRLSDMLGRLLIRDLDNILLPPVPVAPGSGSKVRLTPPELLTISDMDCLKSF